MKSGRVKTLGELNADAIAKNSSAPLLTEDQAERVIAALAGLGDIMESIDARLRDIHAKMPGPNNPPNPTPGNGNGGGK